MNMKLPKREKAFIDKLKIVFHKDDIDAEVSESIKEALDELVAGQMASAISTQRKGFQRRYRVPLNEHHALIVEVLPNTPLRTDWHMAWEYNPSKLTETERDGLVVLARQILGSRFNHLLSNACIKELHVAVDFKVHISEVAVEVIDKAVSATWGKCFGSDGMLQTLYFGSSASEHHLTAYDKSAQVLAAYAAKPHVKLKMVADKAAKQSPRMRLEDRQRPTRNPVPLHRLDELRQPFEGAHVFSFDEAKVDLKSSIHRVALELAKERGLQAAIKVLGKSEREGFRKALMRSQVDWWDARKYGAQLEAALKAIGLFPDSAFDTAARQTCLVERRYQERKQGRQEGGGTASPLDLSDLEDDD